MQRVVFVTTLAIASSAYAKDPADGTKIGATYEAWMSPAQEPGEESESPKPTPAVPAREQRKSRGWAQLRFDRDLSRAYVDVELKGVAPTDLAAVTIQCAMPGVVGPSVVELGTVGDLAKLFGAGKASLELHTKDVVRGPVPHGAKPAAADACPHDGAFTLAALDALARKGALSVNVRTRAAMYYGEMRGQLGAPM